MHCVVPENPLHTSPPPHLPQKCLKIPGVGGPKDHKNVKKSVKFNWEFLGGGVLFKKKKKKTTTHSS